MKTATWVLAGLAIVSAFSGMEALGQNGSMAMDKVLLVGVPNDLAPAWADFLKANSIECRYDRKTRSVYCSQDPVQILEKAARFDTLRLFAQKTLWEREIEASLRRMFPEERDPRVCIALPAYLPTEPNDSEPVAFVMAQSIPAESLAQVRGLFTSLVHGLRAENVKILGTPWKPWPSYFKGSDRETKVAWDSLRTE